MSPLQTHGMELARDDPETLNWMIQGKCEEKMTQLGLIRKNLDDSEQNEIGAFIEAVLQNCHLTNEKPRMTEYVIELEKQLLKFITDLVAVYPVRKWELHF